MQHNRFKHHWFPPEAILCAVRWYCRFALSCRDVRDFLAEGGIDVDASTIHRWVRKFVPEIAKRSFKHRSWRGQSWHVDETYIRVGGKWRYLWRAVDQCGQLVGFRLTIAGSRYKVSKRGAPGYQSSKDLSQTGLRNCPAISTAHHHYRQGT